MKLEHRRGNQRARRSGPKPPALETGQHGFNVRQKARQGHARSRNHGARELPERLTPELATLVDKVPTEPHWLHEIKYDGYRVLCRLSSQGVRLLSRNGEDFTPRMETLAHAIERLRGFGDAWIDGEVVVVDADGKTSFSALQLALSRGHDHDLVYYVFDLPYVNGHNLTDTPLIDRKRQLARLLGNPRKTARVRYSEHSPKNGATFHEYACKFGLEGVISKRADSPYRSERTHDWLKIKCRLRQEFIVAGYTDPTGARKAFGALLLGVYDAQGELRYCGRTGTGFNDALLKSLYPRLKKLTQDRSPFAEPLSREATKGIHWLRPELVAQVDFTSWTRDGLVRQASFQGLREDKPPQEVTHEVPSTVTSEAPESTSQRRRK